MARKRDSEEPELEWFQSSDEVRTGYITGETFGPREVEYSVVDGRPTFEGDIVLDRVVERSSELGSFDEEELSARGIAHGIGITGEEFRWPGGRVPFQIDGTVPQASQTDIRNAVAHWEQNTNISFVERTPQNAGNLPNFLRFVDQGGCWSFVGMRRNQQDISVSPGCGFGAAVHEIGHAVGLWHEQSREDRDRHIRVNWQNIQAGREHNFNQHISDGDDIGPYDFGSIMHYGRFAFSSNGQATIDPLGGQAIGQRNGLSAGDIAAVRALYPQLEPAPQTTRLFRYWNAGAGDHFYTTSWGELGAGRSGWVYEGVQCYVHPNPATGTTPLFRYWNPSLTDHFYTTNWLELRAGAHGWTLEGIQGYVHATHQAGTVPLYRYWNPGIGDHFYTTNWAELGSGRHGWSLEGVQCYVRPLPPVPAAGEEAGLATMGAADEWATIGQGAIMDSALAVAGTAAGQPEGAFVTSDNGAGSGSGTRRARSVTLRIDLE